MIEIISYEDKYQPDFKRLNLEWLDKYDLTEAHDLEMLDDPQKTVIAGGGCIFLAMDGDKVIGSAGLFKMNEREYELIKMGVDPAYRGQGISKSLLNRCLEEAGKIKASTLILYSNSQLKTALKLYEKYGFRHVTAVNAPFLTADVKMELTLTLNQP
ncbi:MAG: GNAT family N-acetyltransferase [Chitinophagaceae bacterium]|nr:GNAT family N-acetyltransferase [Chitinophagaceae bacterium]MBL0273488.1 GNAT family N-acetyltransferase [Chitinophagaceae bacterium]